MVPPLSMKRNIFSPVHQKKSKVRKSLPLSTGVVNWKFSVAEIFVTLPPFISINKSCKENSAWKELFWIESAAKSPTPSKHEWKANIGQRSKGENFFDAKYIDLAVDYLFMIFSKKKKS